MSYDVYIGNSHFNYTYNLSKFFGHFIKGGIDGGLKGLTGAQGYEKIMQALCDVRAYSQQRENGTTAWEYLAPKFDPPNKWGDVMGACLFLAELAYTCKNHPRSKIYVS